MNTLSLYTTSVSYIKTYKRNHTTMLSDNDYEALNSIRSAARMGIINVKLITAFIINIINNVGDVQKLQELCNQFKGNSALLSEKKGDFMGLTPLHWAVSSGASSRKECVKTLIDSGALIDVCNRY